jgi:ribosomal protein L37E
MTYQESIRRCPRCGRKLSWLWDKLRCADCPARGS